MYGCVGELVSTWVREQMHGCVDMDGCVNV